MGEIKGSFSNHLNYTVSDRGFSRTAKEGEPDVTEVVKDGKTYYNKNVKGLEGEFIGISVKQKLVKSTGHTTDLLVMTLKDNGTLMHVSMYLDSSAAKSLISRLMNTETCFSTEGNRISIFSRYTISGKYKNQRIDLYDCAGVIVPFFYTKKNPLPAWEMVTVNGKKVADKTDELNQLKSDVIAINEYVTLLASNKTEDVDLGYEGSVDEDHEDLPLYC